MQNGRMSTRRPRPGGSFTARSPGTNTSAARSPSNGFQSAQRSYERYLALAQEEARSGNVVGAGKLLPARRTLFQIDVRKPTSDVGDGLRCLPYSAFLVVGIPGARPRPPLM
jgi:hypothetical protein